MADYSKDSNVARWKSIYRYGNQFLLCVSTTVPSDARKCARSYFYFIRLLCDIIIICVCVRVSSIRESKKFTLGFPDILCQIAVFSIELTVENHVIVDGSSLGWTITIIQLWGREKKGPSDGNGVGMFTFGYSGMVEGSCPGFFEGTNWGHACV